MRRFYLGSRNDFLKTKLRSKLGSICVHDFVPGDIMKVALVENTNDKLAVAYRFVASDSKDESKDGGVGARYVQRMRIYDLRNGPHWCKDGDEPQGGPRSDADIDELLHQAFQEYHSTNSGYKSFYSNDLYQDFMLENTQTVTAMEFIDSGKNLLLSFENDIYQFRQMSYDVQSQLWLYEEEKNGPPVDRH